MYNVSWSDLYEKYDRFTGSIRTDETYIKAVQEGLVKPCTSFAYDRSFWKRTIIQVIKKTLSNIHYNKLILDRSLILFVKMNISKNGHNK